MNIFNTRKKHHFHDAHSHNGVIEFIIPVTVENTATILVGILFSAITGQISVTSIAAISTVNIIINLLNGVFCILTMGSATLVSRSVGAEDRDTATDVAIQSFGIAIISSAAISVLIFAFARPLMSIIIPEADPVLFDEAVLYCRILMVAFPFLQLCNVGANILRAAGDATKPLISAFIYNVLQVLVAYLLISSGIVPNMGIYGAGIAYLVCRLFGGTAMLFFAIKNKTYFDVNIKTIFKFKHSVIKEIFTLGTPSSIENVTYHAGSLVTNSVLVSLGSTISTTWAILLSVQSFATIPMNVCASSVVTMVGHAIGKGDLERAKKLCLKIAFYCGVFSFAITAILVMFGNQFCAQYSSASDVLELCGGNLWIIALYTLSMFLIYIFENALRTGGDVKFIMNVAIIDTFCIGIPGTFLLCKVFDLGLFGYAVISIATLVMRSVADYLRFRSGKWIKRVPTKA